MSRRLVTLEQAVASVVKKHGGVRAAERATGVDKSFISRLMRDLWAFWQQRDLRTLRKLLPHVPAPVRPWDDRHGALRDAVHQAEHAVLLLRALPDWWWRRSKGDQSC